MPKKALVYCGGGSLGAYEAGVWKYLEEIGERFDIVTGTSIGALMGAMYLCGDLKKCLELWETVEPGKIMTNGINFYEGFLKHYDREKIRRSTAFFKTFIRHKGADFTPLKQLLNEVIDPKKVKESPVRLGVVTTAFPSFKECDIDIKTLPEEDIIPYLLASSCCWPVFSVHKIGDKKYVDGGFRNNLPISLALDYGAEEVVAVRLPSYPRTPQNAHLMKRKDVRVIAPSRKVGFVLDFYPKTCKRNIALGYLDAKKSYGNAYGYAFTFEKDPKFLELANAFVYAVGPLHKRFRKKELRYEKMIPWTPIEIYIRSLEILMDDLEMDFHKEYSITSLKKDLKSHLKADPEKPDFIAKNVDHSLAKWEWKQFLISYLNRKDDPRWEKRIAGYRKKNPKLALYLPILEWAYKEK